MKPFPIVDFNMNAEEELLKDLEYIDGFNLNYADEMIDPSEYEGNTAKPEYRNHNATQGQNNLMGIALGAGALYGASKMMPKNFPRHLANHASNFLEGFYAKDANKLKLYSQEMTKSLGRLGLTALNPREAISYGNTGISSLIEGSIGNLKNDLRQVDAQYIRGDFGESGDTAIKKAKALKNRLIKERHYKVLNDAANREIFGGDISKPLSKYRTRKPHLRNWWDVSSGKEFIKSAGKDKQLAEYLVNRHGIGKGELPFVGRFFKNKDLSMVNPNLKFIKWFDNSISGTLRGAQFNYKTYEILEALKRNRMGQGAAMSALKSAGYNPHILKNGNIVFSFNPSIKSNFDWGGYNATAEWNYKKPGRVRFHATDLRDTPISSMFKGKHVLNYVESKEVNIATMKNHVDTDSKPKLRPQTTKPKTRGTNVPKLLTREEIVKSGQLRSGGVYKTIMKDLDTLRGTKLSSKKKLTAKNVIKSAIKNKKLPKNVLKYLTRAGGVGLAAGSLIMLAKAISDRD